MDKQKTTLLDAYVRKVIALGKIHLIESKQGETDSAKKSSLNLDEIDAIFVELGKFVDVTDPKVSFDVFPFEVVLLSDF